MTVKIDERQEAVRHLKSGGMVIYPTETAYALGADAANKQAVERVFKLKKRLLRKPLPVIVGSLRQAKRIAKFNKQVLELAKRFWPGPLTLVLPVRHGAGLTPGAHSHTTKHDSVAMRIPSHPIARALARGLGKPVVSTSANLAGKGHCYSVAAIKKQFQGDLPEDLLVLDAGVLSKKKLSTIVRVVDDKIETLRPGAISI